MRCPAKLNLTLAVGPPRSDGLHPIASVMVALQFCDDLHIKRIEGESRFTRRLAEDAPKPQPIDWPLEDDLLFRAHALMQATVGHALPADCELLKRIPAGAGLGGGSSNAAGMLVALRDVFELDMFDDRLIELGQSLGADVGFLVHALLGRPAALVTGIGDIVAPLPQLPEFHVVLAFPDGQCPTAAVYQAFDRQPTTADASEVDNWAGAWAGADQLPAVHNDLSLAAEQVCPAIRSLFDAITSQQLEPGLTGSGSAVFAVVESQEQAVAIADVLREQGFSACASAFCP